MNKCLIALWLVFFPLFAMASASTSGSSLSLAPPASDFSVIFLGNLFGIVDGVLHGTGSQIMGAIFTVFNSAVLALGGIVIMYTLIVGTMNTAHEGEMLGHKWSSIWIPVRSTAGLALLIPKASGYCLMQIFVMWVVVQGVGAADKVWAAALNYLNRGGVIVQASINPGTSMTADANQIAAGASAILASQVCMLGLQKELEATRKTYLASAAMNPSLGPCSSKAVVKTIKNFCTTPVPDLLATVDAPAFQTANTSSTGATPAVFSMPVPYFGESSNNNYAFLQGICGNINWNPLPAIATPGAKGDKSAAGYQASANQISDSQVISLSRATAVQQLYVDLQVVAQNMVTNDPMLVSPPSSSTVVPACPQATNVFGVPYSASSATPCSGSTASNDCILWQGGYACNGSTTGVPIFNGTEFQSAIADYNGVMMPTLNLMNQLKNSETASQARAFIATANTQGWLSAGSYFFDLVNLNGSATSSANLTDTNTGLQGSQAAGGLSSAFNIGAKSCVGQYATLCTWLTAGNNSVQVAANNVGAINTLLGTAPISYTPSTVAVTGSSASTTYGFVKNSLAIQLSGQPPLKGPAINVSLFPALETAQPSMDLGTPACNGFRLLRVRICIGRYIMQGIYSLLQAWMTFFMNILAVWINNFILIVVSIPLATLQGTFVTGVQYLTNNPGSNPIVVLAEMGIFYINAPANLYVAMVTMSLGSLFLGPIGVVIYGIFIGFLLLASPLIISWMGVMLAVGFTTAFYVPFLPYMIFTFGVIAWFMAVIEAMAAAPIVALAITHPEGEGILGGKGEGALLILMNVFLRPAMMIIGYISAIALCYVSVWIINSGFAHVLSFIQNGTMYTGWAGLYVLFFSVVIYTSMYVTVVQKAFNLIYQLPDQVLRWIGGHAEQTGHEAAGWAGETKEQIKAAGEASDKGQSGVMEKTVGAADKGLRAAKGAKSGGTDLSATGSKTPPT